ncbi:MAG: Oxysterol binding protein [Chrysothrix sp. TS-e1954]|nr:MAG: Oxysterol binding protein [Chrysothrix sp. TS-e1954]
MSSSSKEEASAVPPQAKGSWTSFIRTLASYNGDLSSITAPPFILSSTSLTEFSLYWAEHPAVFVAPANEPDPQKRALLVLKWFLTTLKQQYGSRSEKLGSEKKPLNPFLGEIFLGKWEDAAGETQLVSEQVNHHPPVTAYCIWNKDNGVRLQGYNGQKASFSRRIDVAQIGHAMLHLDKYDEDYLITLPPLHIEGLFGGSPFVELNRQTYIHSSSGFTGKVDYSGRGWLSGKKNSFTASLYQHGKEKDPLYTIDGQWTGSFTIKDGKGKQTLDTWEPKSNSKTSLMVAKLEDQDELESRRAWKKVADSINKGDMNATSLHKSTIENSQRELRKKEQAEGREWDRIFFTRTEKDPLFSALASKIGVGAELEKTNGIWRFDQQKADSAKPPFRKGAMPSS